MAIGRFKDLCLDAGDPARLGAFWAAVLGRTWEAQANGDGLLAGATPQHTLWVYGVPVTKNDGWFTLEGVPGMPILTMDFVPVPEPKTVKNRIHWDVTVPGVAPLVEAGATVLREPGGGIGWHVLADPEGNEFCAFTE